MSIKSNYHGRAFEYACVQTLYNEINKTRLAVIEKTQAFSLLNMLGIK